MADRFDGIGFCLRGTETAAFDIDDCRDASGVIHPWALGVIERAGSYTEITPSGTGLRIIGLGTGAEIQRKIPVVDGVSCEVYRSTTRYITVTGNQIGDCVALANIDATIDAVVAELDEKEKEGNREKKQQNGRPNFDDETVSDDELDDLIKNGCGDKYDGHRSRAVWRVIHGLLRQGKNTEAILKVILNPDNKISEHIYDKPNPEAYARKQVENAIAKAPVTIIVYRDRLSAAVDETQRAIMAKGRPVYSRAHTLVEPIWTEYPASKGRKTKITILRPFDVHNLSYLLTKHVARYRAHNAKGELISIEPPIDMRKQMLSISHWVFSHVAGISCCPTLRPDGTILDKLGYDAATQLWASWDDNFVLPIPERPTKDAALEALKLYQGLLVEFPFVSDTDKSVALAAILTAVLRGAFDLAPMFFVLASTAGTGKSYLIDIVATIVTGRWCPAITGSKNEEELEKRIGAVLLEGISMISLDNLSYDLKGDILNKMLTQRLVKVRILGKSVMPECEWRGMLFANGNNTRLVGDLTRRGLICNLDAKDERPELRKFKFNPIERVLVDRGKYVAAGLTIARAYLASGEKVTCSPIGSFEEWSAMVREPLIWLGCDDPVKSLDQAREEDPQRSAARELIAQWDEHLGTTQAYKAGEIIAKATEAVPNPNFSGQSNWVRVRPEFHTLLVEQAGFKGEPDVVRLGHWLRALKNQVHAGYRIIGFKGTHGIGWKLERIAR